MTGDTLFERVRATLRPEYEVEAELGRGGMGAVYLARDAALRRQVALKVLLPEVATEWAVEAFQREAQVLARIESHHVVVVHTVDERGGLYFFVMELIQGGTLAERLKRGPMTARQTLLLGLDLLTGLEAIHQAGVVHRDLKPSNVFPLPGRGVIGDFGIARDELATRQHTSSTADRGRGTLAYMAPEQLAGERPTTATDIYQIGAVLYQSCTGRLWLVGAAGDPRSWAGVPRWLRPVLRHALQIKPEDRWPDAAAFRTALLAAGRSVMRPLAIGLTVLLGVVIAWAMWPPRGRPSVDLAILRFAGPDSLVAKQLTRSVQEPFERFGRIRVRPAAEIPVFPDRPTPRQIADLQATYFVEGDVEGDSVMNLTVHDSSRSLRGIRVPHGSLDRLSWGWASADSIVQRFFTGDYQDFHAVAGCGGSNDANAIDEYLAGEQAFQRDAYAKADRHFSLALEHDPRFLLAAWQRALAHRWLRTQTWAELRELYEGPVACRDAWYYRLLEAQLDQDLPGRFARYDEIIRQNPRLGVARLLDADELFHRGALTGLPLDSALTVMREALRGDSSQDQAPALDHLIWGEIRLGHRDSAGRAVEQRRQVADAHRTPEYEEGSLRTRFLALAYDERFRRRWGDLELGWLAWRPDPEILEGFAEYVHLANAFDIPAAQLRMGQALVRYGTSESMRAEGFEAQGLSLILLGRPAAAVLLFDSSAAHLGTAASALEAVEWRVLPRALGLPDLPPLEHDLGLEKATALLADSAVGQRAAWALATEAYSRGDTTVARQLARRIRRDASPGTVPARLDGLLAALDSAATGHLSAALAASASLLVWDPNVRAGDPFARAVLYLSRSSWLERLGRLADAERAVLWYENSDLDGWGLGEAQAGQVDAAVSAVARVRRAHVARARGDPASACGLLRRVGELWQGADPSFRAARDSVTAELESCR